MTMRKTILAGILGVLMCASLCLAEEIDVFWLAEKGTSKQLQEALNDGAKFNVENEDGETPLHRAASSNKNPDAIKFLIEQGLDVNAVLTEEYGAGNANIDTPLSCAVRNKNIAAIKELLKAGADPEYWSIGYSYSSGNIASGSMFHLVAVEYTEDASLAKDIIEALVEASGDVVRVHRKGPRQSPLKRANLSPEKRANGSDFIIRLGCRQLRWMLCYDSTSL